MKSGKISPKFQYNALPRSPDSESDSQASNQQEAETSKLPFTCLAYSSTPDDGGSAFPRNVSELLPNYTPLFYKTVLIILL
jgi:hypothetical protein